jgi:hypothetical protein
MKEKKKGDIVGHISLKVKGLYTVAENLQTNNQVKKFLSELTSSLVKDNAKVVYHSQMNLQSPHINKGLDTEEGIYWKVLSALSENPQIKIQDIDSLDAIFLISPEHPTIQQIVSKAYDYQEDPSSWPDCLVKICCKWSMLVEERICNEPL